MDTRLITDSFLCPDSNWLLVQTVLVLIATDNGHFYVTQMTGNAIRHLTLRTLVINAPYTSHQRQPKRGGQRQQKS